MNQFWRIGCMLVLALLLGVTASGFHPVSAAGGLSLYTPYTNITVTPGETIDYNIEVINSSTEIQKAEFMLRSLDPKWKHQLTSGGWTIDEIAVLPDERKTVSLQVEIPLEVDKGNYRFDLVAKGKSILPLTVNVSENGTLKTELTSEQPNMQGHANSTYQFEANLRNRTAQKQLYSLHADTPRGWDVQFKADGKSVTSVNVEANANKSLDIEINPPENVKAGSYKIPIEAMGSTSAQLVLEVVVTGSYDMKLSTPTGLLSSEVTAGDKKNVELEVTNTGSAPLKDIELKAETPLNWEVTFEPKKIDQLEAGKSSKVTAMIKANEKAIAGDYVTDLTATTPETSSDAQLRISVKTSLLWGWFGILIILGVIGGVYYLFRTYGRR